MTCFKSNLPALYIQVYQNKYASGNYPFYLCFFAALDFHLISKHTFHACIHHFVVQQLKDKQMKKLHALPIILFGVAFAAPGIWFGWHTLKTIDRAVAIRQWIPCPATITTCSLETRTGSKGGTSYKVTASYKYTVADKEYTSSQVTLDDEFDNIGSFHKRAYTELLTAQQEGHKIICMTDPDDPYSAILYPDIRFEKLAFMLIFVILFSSSGLGIITNGVVILFQRTSHPANTLGFTTQRMRTNPVLWIITLLGIANAAFITTLFYSLTRISPLHKLPWYLWLHTIPSAITLALAAYFVGRHRKYGISRLNATPWPAVKGQSLSGMISIPAKVEAPHGIMLTLKCIHQYTSGSGKNRTIHRSALWEDNQLIQVPNVMESETTLQIRFQIPEDPPATTVPGGQNGYYWQLEAKAKTPGIDYYALFDIPVTALKS